MAENQKQPSGGSPPSTPRWVKVFVVIFVLLVLLIVILHLMGFGFGEHTAAEVGVVFLNILVQFVL